MTDSSKPDSRRIKSVDLAFNIIDLIEKGGSVTLSKVAEEMEMPLSTAHIHLSTLVQNGYLFKADGEYQCSFKFLQKGGRIRDDMTLFQVAKPELDDLQSETGEHTNLMVEEQGYAVQLYKSQGSETIDDDAPLGKYFHPHTTATGKAILAQQPDDLVEEVIAKLGLPALTEKTITEKNDLFDELEGIRDLGYSINREEHYSGVSAVGVAIESEDNEPLGAISISGPIGRMSEERIHDELAPLLLTKKNVIELKVRQRR